MVLRPRWRGMCRPTVQQSPCRGGTGARLGVFPGRQTGVLAVGGVRDDRDQPAGPASLGDLVGPADFVESSGVVP